MKIIKILKGFSGSRVTICSKGKISFVRKENNIKRNIQRFKSLKKIVNLPKIYKISKNYYDMEYIDGISMRQYLIEHDIKKLSLFISSVLKKISVIEYGIKDYSNTYKIFLKNIKFDKFIFSKKNLFDKLPKKLPQTQYHGDFTLENIIFKKKFFLIDCSEGIFDSFIFDYSKLRQDIEVFWFLRNKKNINNTILLKLNFLKKELLKTFKYYNNKYLLILMLLRIFRYVKKNSHEKLFLIKKINKIWKL
jgi:tRNA A-37 threonylcarbamoyl transferase component Bud32